MTREEAISILEQRKCCRECVADCTCKECDDAFDMAINELRQEPKTDNILIPKGTTNGDVIKTMFPTTQIRNNGNFISFTLDGIVGTAVEKDWWNTPYQSEVSE